MKHYLKGLFFLICFFSSSFLSAAYDNDSPPTFSEKLYVDSKNVEITDNGIYIHLENHLIETSVIRTDQHGFYIFENDITKCAVEIEKKWKCPYCFFWWPIGLKCQNEECPTNKW